MSFKENPSVRRVKAFLSFEKSIMREWKSLLELIEKDVSITWLCVNFSIGEMAFQMSGLFKSGGIHDIQGGKFYQSNYVVLPFKYSLV